MSEVLSPEYRREVYRTEALRMGRPPLPCPCPCGCPLHAYQTVPGPGLCLWCRHGEHVTDAERRSAPTGERR